MEMTDFSSAFFFAKQSTAVMLSHTIAVCFWLELNHCFHHCQLLKLQQTTTTIATTKQTLAATL
jgi:hypothetical protein